MSGFTAEGLASFDAAMQELAKRGAVPGIVTLLAHGDDVHTGAYGVADIATGTLLRDDAIFRIQSMTKPILAAATMQLVERGVIALDDPVERWLPELANRMVLRAPDSDVDDIVPATRSMTVEDLLTCRSGYGMVFADPSTSPILRAIQEHHLDPGPLPRLEPSDAWLARLAKLPLIHQPGEGWRYHTSFDILGILLSRVSGSSLGDHLRDAIFEPLGMEDTSLFVPAEKRDRLPAVYQEEDGTGELIEIEPAAGGHHAEEPAFDVSHGELVSTARDYHRFASMLLRGGEVDGVRVLSGDSVAAMTRDHIEPAQKTNDAFFPGFWDENGWGYGMGVMVVRDAFGEPGRYHWMGGYGTAWFNDPATGLIGILLMQVFGDESVMETVNAFYRASYDLVT